MDEKTDGSAMNEKIGELGEKILQLDDICIEILLTLMAKKELRTNQLYRSVIRFSSSISKPTFHDHLKHLVSQGFIERKEEDPQNVTYGLTKESKFAVDDLEGVSRMMKIIENMEGLRPYGPKERYRKLTEKELEQHIDHEIKSILSLNLHELKTYIQYELKTTETMSNRDFWKFVGNPISRLLERSVLEDCRGSEEYKKKLFEKLDILINELKGDKEPLNEGKKPAENNFSNAPA